MGNTVFNFRHSPIFGTCLHPGGLPQLHSLNNISSSRCNHAHTLGVFFITERLIASYHKISRVLSSLALKNKRCCPSQSTNPAEIYKKSIFYFIVGTHVISVASLLMQCGCRNDSESDEFSPVVNYFQLVYTNNNDKKIAHLEKNTSTSLLPQVYQQTYRPNRPLRPAGPG